MSHFRAEQPYPSKEQPTNKKSLIDICGYYEQISTKFSEMCLITRVMSFR